jgi:hypothetical protein
MRCRNSSTWETTPTTRPPAPGPQLVEAAHHEVNRESLVQSEPGRSVDCGGTCTNSIPAGNQKPAASTPNAHSRRFSAAWTSNKVRSPGSPASSPTAAPNSPCRSSSWRSRSDPDPQAGAHPAYHSRLRSLDRGQDHRRNSRGRPVQVPRCLCPPQRHRPLPVWSSNKARHRLSRTGNRQLNDCPAQDRRSPKPAAPTRPEP